MYILTVLFITRFANIFPDSVVQIHYVIGMVQIGLLLCILLFLHFLFQKREMKIPKSIHYTYIIIIGYFLFELIRTFLLYEQRLVPTVQIQRQLVCGLFMYFTPLVINSKEKLFRFLRIMFFFSFICFLFFLYQKLTHSLIFDTFHSIIESGGLTFLRFASNVPFVLIFFAFGFVYYLLNSELKCNKRMVLLLSTVIIAAYSIIITFNRTFWIITLLCVSIIIYLSRKKRRFAIISIGLLLLLLLFSSPLSDKFSFITERSEQLTSDVSSSGGTFGYRVDLFMERFNLIKENNLLFGLGLVNVENPTFDSYLIVGGPTSNNKYIQHPDIGFASLIAHLGLVGLLIYLLLIFLITYQIYKNFKTCDDLKFKSIFIALICLNVWLLIATFTRIGIYGDNLFYIFLAAGLTIAIKKIYAEEIKHEKT